MAEQITKQDPYICCLQGTHFWSKDTQTETKGMEKNFHQEWKQTIKNTEAATLIPDKVDLKTKAI